MARFQELPYEILDDIISRVDDPHKFHAFLFNRSTHGIAKIALYSYVKLILWKENDWEGYDDRFPHWPKTGSKLPIPNRIKQGALVFEQFQHAATVSENAALLTKAKSLDIRLSSSLLQTYTLSKMTVMDAATSRQWPWFPFLGKIFLRMPSLQILFIDSPGFSLDPGIPSVIFSQWFPNLRDLTIRNIPYHQHRLHDSHRKLFVDLRDMGNLRSVRLIGAVLIELPANISLNTVTRLKLTDYPGEFLRSRTIMKSRYSSFTGLRDLHLAVKGEYSPRDALNKFRSCFAPSKLTLETISLHGDAAVKKTDTNRKCFDFSDFTALNKLCLPAKPELLPEDDGIWRCKLVAPTVELVELIITSAEPTVLSSFVENVLEAGALPRSVKYSFRVDRNYLDQARREDYGNRDDANRYLQTIKALRELENLSGGVEMDISDVVKFLEGVDKENMALQEKDI